MSDLDEIYSDLSDNEENKKHKLTPVAVQKEVPIKAQPKMIIKMPDFLGGKAFIPPPPPPSSKPAPRSHPHEQYIQGRGQNQNYYHQQVQRQRKNIIYVKNIPKTYNRQQTLTTFFRTYGNIKSIKTNETNNTAFIRFQKEQDALKFMNAKPPILNRSYISYDINQDFEVPSEKLIQREKEQNASVVNSTEKQLLMMKQNSESLLADKYRSLLFLYKNKTLLTEQECIEIQKQMHKCRKIKQSESNDQELGQMLANLQNQYDWTLTYKQLTRQGIQKKKIINQFNKYGPIGTINIKLTQIPNQGEGNTDNNQNKLGIIKIKYLGVRSSWEMFLQNFHILKLEVDGNKLNDIFKSWLVVLSISINRKNRKIKSRSIPLTLTINQYKTINIHLDKVNVSLNPMKKMLPFKCQILLTLKLLKLKRLMEFTKKLNEPKKEKFIKIKNDQINHQYSQFRILLL